MPPQSPCHRGGLAPAGGQGSRARQVRLGLPSPSAALTPRSPVQDDAQRLPEIASPASDSTRPTRVQVDEFCELTPIVTADRLRGFERPPSGEDCESPEQLLLRWSKQFVTPVERSMNCPVQAWSTATVGLDASVSTGQSTCALLNAERPDPRGRSFNCEWYALQPNANLQHRWCSFVIEHEVGLG